MRPSHAPATLTFSVTLGERVNELAHPVLVFYLQLTLIWVTCVKLWCFTSENKRARHLNISKDSSVLDVVASPIDNTYMTIYISIHFFRHTWRRPSLLRRSCVCSTIGGIFKALFSSFFGTRRIVVSLCLSIFRHSSSQARLFRKCLIVLDIEEEASRSLQSSQRLY